MKELFSVKSIALFFGCILPLLLSGCDSDSDEVSHAVEEFVEVAAPLLLTTETTTLVDGSVVDTASLIRLGNIIYHDTNLSTPIGQSCASCHDLTHGFSDPNDANPTSVGADGVSFGDRNAPTASYSAHIPSFILGRRGAEATGGLFLDGRANSLEEQAKGPFLNAVEMGNESAAEVIAKVATSTYASEFEGLFGDGVLDNVDQSYDYLISHKAPLLQYSRSTII